MVIQSNPVIDITEAIDLDPGARFVHEGKGRICLAFRKAIDKLSSQVGTCAFASDETVQRLLNETEDLFTARFGGTFVDRIRYHPDDFCTQPRATGSALSFAFAGFRLTRHTTLVLSAQASLLVWHSLPSSMASPAVSPQNIQRCLLSLLQPSSLRRVSLYPHGGACSTYTRFCWSPHS